MDQKLEAPTPRHPPSSCSPDAYSKTYLTKQRCLSNSDIQGLATELFHSPTKELSSKSTDHLYRKLQRVLGPDPTTWASHPALRGNRKLRARISQRFRPKRPSSWRKNPTTWLSTSNIEGVMRQYRRLHPDFVFLGVHSRDFASLRLPSVREVKRPPLDKYLQSGKRHLGAVFNLDRYDQAGSHWVAVFISLDPTSPMYGAYYYDSVARVPPEEIAEWMVRIKGDSRLPETRRMFELTWNRERRQFLHTECGMFAMAFLATAMENSMSFREVCDGMGTDEDMLALRKIMFR
jgi:hypothetical protein